MNEFNVEICYPDYLADPFYEEDLGANVESEEELKRLFAGSCINEVHYA